MTEAQPFFRKLWKLKFVYHSATLRSMSVISWTAWVVGGIYNLPSDFSEFLFYILHICIQQKKRGQRRRNKKNNQKNLTGVYSKQHCLSPLENSFLRVVDDAWTPTSWLLPNDKRFFLVWGECTGLKLGMLYSIFVRARR